MRTVAAAVCSLLAAPTLIAQCALEWRGGYGCPGSNGGVFDAVNWDPDGAGPLPPVVVLAGGFSLVGEIACTGLAAWNPATGAVTSLPVPPQPTGQCLAVGANGALFAVVAGFVGSAEAWQVVELGSAGWTPLGLAFPHTIHDLHVRPNGEVVVSGFLDPLVGPANFGAVARWNGTAWVSLGIQGQGWALADLANGDLAVSSRDTLGAAAYHTWNGASAVPFASSGPTVAHSIERAANGVLFASADGLWSWNGTSWTAHVPPPSTGAVPGSASRIAVTAGGDILASMALAVGSPWSSLAVRFSPASGSWNVLPGVFDHYGVGLLDLPGNGALAFGSFAAIDGRSATHVARWNGTSWQSLRDGAPPYVSCVTPMAGDRLAIGGTFLSCGSIATANVAEWTGAAWTSMGAGLNGTVLDLLRLPNGDVFAGGEFSASGALPASRLARWNGSAWSAVGGGVTHATATPWVSQLARLPNGDVVVGGMFTAAGGVPANNIARWNGVAWSPLGAGVPGAVGRMVVAPNGDVLVSLQTPTAQVSRWDGATWTTLLSGGNRVVHSIAVLADGSAFAGGYVAGLAPSPSQGQGFVTRLPATSPSLQVFADQPVTDLVALPGGDALVFGSFSTIGGTSAAQMARLQGSTPTPTFGAVGSGAPAAEGVFAENGELLVVSFQFGPQPLHGVARLAATCPATVTAAGSGCVGSGGPNVLTATSLPWTGATYRATATGMAANGIALGVLGLGTVSLPLAAILPQGVAGCSLLVTPDLLDAHVPVAGTVTTELAIPSVAALVGQSLHQQFVSLEFAATAITALTSTNALTLTIGAY